jgi:hypothetical protein
VILPTKHLSQDRALLTIGGRILPLLSMPKTVSATWEEFSKSTSPQKSNIRYDHYVLALDLLYLMGAIELIDGLLYRTKP